MRDGLIGLEILEKPATEAKSHVSETNVVSLRGAK